MDKTLESINWEDVKDVKFYYNPITDYINIYYEKLDDIQLTMDNCIPVKVPPDEDIVAKISSNVKTLGELQSEDINKIKEVYKNEKTLKIYSVREERYILQPHIEPYIENEGRLDRWEQFKKDVKEKWELSKPKTILELKEQVVLKQKELDKMYNQILKLT